ncbi:hypothetical protein [Marinagarivorans algicola]|uniref:hypothetical protein n=1 Tax=Marinagarivorans algicola TaxID=1513270 RepID=UPI001FD1C3B4|nr:hypothetical protein [Marinagarivorans algicola]
MKPKNIAISPAANLERPEFFGTPIWRTPHLGQISALTLIIAAHSEQYFSLSDFDSMRIPLSGK